MLAVGANNTTGKSDATVAVEVTVISVLGVLCLPANLFLIVATTRAQTLHTPSNMLILNLAVTDLLVAMLVLPVWIVTTHSQFLTFDKSICIGAGMANLLLFLESLSTLSVIAVDKYICICKPLKYVYMITNKRIGILITYTWTQSTFLAAMPLFGFGKYGFRTSELSLCNIDFSYDIIYTMCVLLTTILPSLSTMFFCYYKIFCVARNQARRVNATLPQTISVASLRVGGTWANPSDIPNLPPVNRRGSFESDPSDANHGIRVVDQGNDQRSETISNISSVLKPNGVNRSRSFRTILTILGVFLVCWTPFIVLMIYTSATKLKPSYILEFIVTYLAFCNSFANPIICVTKNRQLRKILKKWAYPLSVHPLPHGVMLAAVTVTAPGVARVVTNTENT